MVNSSAENKSNPIEKTRGVCGGKARIAGTRIPVWGIEHCRELGMSVADILLDYPSLERDDVLAAWEYAAQNKKEIAAQIRMNCDE